MSLKELHAGCDSNTKSRSPDCVAAMHRFCQRVTYPTKTDTLGVSQEHTSGKIFMSCIHSEWSGFVSIAELKQHLIYCGAKELSQNRNCLAAVHRYCQARLGGADYAGTSQEVDDSKDSFYVQCFKTARKEHVLHDVLQSYHSTCQSGAPSYTSESDNCFAAASRWCRQLGYSGGITQEVNGEGVTVACYNDEFSNFAYVTRNKEFFVEENRVDLVCSLDFDVNQGKILGQMPQYLKIEMYDNIASSVPLRTNFQLSQQITEKSSFTHSHKFMIGISSTLSVTANLPSVSVGGSLTVSTSLTSGISLTKETTKTTSYTTESPVEVPAGKGIMVEAVVQKANLDVPWNAKIINGLGAAATIGGQWKGVTTFNFRVTQEDIDGFCPCSAVLVSSLPYY